MIDPDVYIIAHYHPNKDFLPSKKDLKNLPVFKEKNMFNNKHYIFAGDKINIIKHNKRNNKFFQRIFEEK